jgi:hypothetical protein
MDIAISIKDLFIFLIGAGVIVLIVYLILLVANRNKTIKLTNTILEDVEIITKTAAKRTEDVDKIVDDIAGAVGVVTTNLKGNVSIVKVGTSLVNLITTIRGIVKVRSDKKAEQAETAEKQSKTAKKTSEELNKKNKK